MNNCKTGHAVQTCSILFVDDDVELAQSIQRYYRRDPAISLDIALSGLDAIRNTENKHYDVIIADWRMPTMNGVELLLILSRRVPNSKLVLATAYPEAKRISKVVNEAGVRMVLIKPIDLRELRESLIRLSYEPDGA
ncbi:MAG: response regulator [Spirochaetales bacterium]